MFLVGTPPRLFLFISFFGGAEPRVELGMPYNITTRKNNYIIHYFTFLHIVKVICVLNYNIIALPL